VVLVVEVEGAVDEGDVRERLREVAELPTRPRVPLLGEQPEFVASREHALEQLFGLVEPALERESVREPERARQKRALTGRQAVDPRSSSPAYR
jgi:hypothetical protein